MILLTSYHNLGLWWRGIVPMCECVCTCVCVGEEEGVRVEKKNQKSIRPKKAKNNRREVTSIGKKKKREKPDL